MKYVSVGTIFGLYALGKKSEDQNTEFWKLQNYITHLPYEMN